MWASWRYTLHRINIQLDSIHWSAYYCYSIVALCRLESEDVSWETGMGLWNGNGLPKPDANEAISIQDGLILYSHFNANNKCCQQATSVYMSTDICDDCSHIAPFNMADTLRLSQLAGEHGNRQQSTSGWDPAPARSWSVIRQIWHPLAITLPITPNASAVD